METLASIPFIYYAIAMMIISAIITALTMKRPANPTPPTPANLTDFQFPQITEGTPQIVVFGDVWLQDWTVLWYGDLEIQPINRDVPGKK